MVRQLPLVLSEVEGAPRAGVTNIRELHIPLNIQFVVFFISCSACYSAALLLFSSTSESFTTTPAMPTIPIIPRKLKGSPRSGSIGAALLRSQNFVSALLTSH